MSRDPLAYVTDMLACARRVLVYAEGLDFQAFAARGMAYDAILRNLAVLGEAARGVPQQLRERYPDVEWRSMAGLRDVLVHRYAGLEDETIWDVVTNKMPPLIAKLVPIAAATDNAAPESDAGDSGNG